MKKRKILQITPTLVYGDGVGNDILAINHFLKNKEDITTKVYCENIDTLIPRNVASTIDKLPELNDDDIVIYHLSTGSKLNQFIQGLNGIKILRYHNITPSDWFRGYNIEMELICKRGLEEAKNLSNWPDYCLADSEFNKQDLLNMGYHCPIDVLPIVIPFEDYDDKPTNKIITKYQDEYVNVLFTGRVAPNKKHEDIIQAFSYYQKYYNPKSRLMLIGSYNGMEKYYYKLLRYAEELKAENVFFMGHIKFNDLLAYFTVANVFLCLSEHEGFCIPIVEAMHFGMPIVAYDCCAIGDTLQEGGILLKEKNLLEIAGVINYVIKNKTKLLTVLNENQQTRLKDMMYENVTEKFWHILEKIINKKVGGNLV